MKDALLAAS